MQRFFPWFMAIVFAFHCTLVHSQVVINEMAYDDGGTDDLEFIELYNAGVAAVDISGWTITGQDEAGPNWTGAGAVTIPASTTLAAGDYYVIANPSVPNVDLQASGASTFENDAEYNELRDSGGNLIDAFLYEANKGPGDGVNPPGTTTTGYGVLSAAQLAQVGSGITPGYFSNAIGSDTANLVPTGSLSRFQDGVDTNNNGRDFGFRPATPGATNSPTLVTNYVTDDVSVASGLFVGDPVPGWAYGFDAPPRVIQPTTDIVADPTNRNPNVIPAPPTGEDRAIITYDPAGGGNGYAAKETFDGGEGSFDLWVYFDTTDFPQNTNGAGVQFRGSEYSYFNLGGADSVANFSDLNGPGFDNPVNGSTGLTWVYEKTQPLDPSDPNPATNGVIEKLYLVDAGDGGWSDTTSSTGNPVEWDILAIVDLSTTPSGWYRLSLSVSEGGALAGDENEDGTVDAADYVALRKAGLSTDDFVENFGESGGGDNGFARFNDQEFTFSTDSKAGAFGTGYRENLQIGADGTPDAIMRPPTFVQYEAIEIGAGGAVPEPSSLALVAIAGLMLAGRRKRSS